MLNTDKNLKLYYSISEVAAMFDVNESLLRFWEKEFPQLNPKKGGRGIRQYRKEDIETVKLIYHLVKERGMTLPGARQRMKDNKEATIRNFEIVDRLRANVFYVRKINVLRFHFLHHFRTSTPIKFMPGYLGGYCLPVYLFGEVVLQCRHTCLLYTSRCV